ncbi:hypothetical protein ACLESO_45795, partial [Pyxidicoccus sp. 3LG]
LVRGDGGLPVGTRSGGGWAVSVHAGQLPAGQGTGDLLHLPTWVAESPGTGLVATEAMLEGLEAGFVTEPLAEGGRSRVTASR